MTSGRKDSLRLFRFLGIDVYVHWAWIFVAIYQIQYRSNAYSSIGWKIAEYLALFLIVLIHEFGHALAARQVGGTANQILLWPLGGVAYVSLPPRPGAELWGIAAGPLVNVVLFFVLTAVLKISGIPLGSHDLTDSETFLSNLWMINVGLLIFNLIPVYPLDGGQILRALLWYPLGRVRSLYVAVIVGFVGVAGLAFWALQERSIWLGVIAFYIFSNCRQGWTYAQALSARQKAPRRPDFACPSCAEAPLIGNYWACHHCGTSFDTFETQAVCPNCQAGFPTTQCNNCHASNPIADWRTVGSPIGKN